MEDNLCSKSITSKNVPKKFLITSTLDPDVVKQAINGFFVVLLCVISIILTLNINLSYFKSSPDERVENVAQVNDAVQVKPNHVSNEIYKFTEESLEYQNEEETLKGQQDGEDILNQMDYANLAYQHDHSNSDLIKYDFLATTEQHFSEIR